MSILVANNLFKSYNIGDNTSQPVLKDVSLEISQGENIALTGPSGAGKSTLLYLLASMESADSGSISLKIDYAMYNYGDLSKERLAELRNIYMGFVFQFHHLLPEFSALENVAIPALIAGLDKKVAFNSALDLLSQLGLKQLAHKKPTRMSGGEQQRVAIARALINNPKIVFADEPTGNLDSENTLQILNILKDLCNRNGTAFIVATHDQQVAQAADRIVNMIDGQIAI